MTSGKSLTLRFLVCSHKEILSIFGVSSMVALCGCNTHTMLPIQYTDEKVIKDIQYITFLLMVRMGLRGLEFYDPSTGKHGQAHMQAR